VPGCSAANWWGVAAPAGTPQPVIATLHKEITAVLSSDEVRKRFAAEGAVVVQMSTAEFTKFVETELEKWGKVVKEAKITAE
jgi:tripartite-type tricarboxylate transporter receptor subunit TctC